MAIVSFFVFGGAMMASSYAIWATVRPEFARITDLLVHGPVATPVVAAPSPLRGSLRIVRARDVVLAPRSPQRAAA